MGQIGFSVTFQDEQKVKLALKQLNKKHINLKHVKVFVRNHESDASFLKLVNPTLFKIAFKSGIIGGCVGVVVFFIIWAITNNFITGLSTFRMALLTLITGAAVGIFLGVAISVISKEALVPLSIHDIEGEKVVLDFKVDGNFRESVEKILKKAGADQILED